MARPPCSLPQEDALAEAERLVQRAENLLAHQRTLVTRAAGGLNTTESEVALERLRHTLDLMHRHLHRERQRRGTA